MRTRIANAGDFATVLPMTQKRRLLQQTFDRSLYELRPDADKLFRRWVGEVAEDPRAMLLVAEEDGRVIGFLSATVEKDMPIYVCDEYAVVREWWVEPEFRGRGAGKALLQQVINELSAVGLRQLRIRTDAADAEARAMLAHCGFRAGSTDMLLDLSPPA